MTQTDEARLLPCPWCGGSDLQEDATCVLQAGGVDLQSGWIECRKCDAKGPSVEVANTTMQPARDAWNRRAAAPAAEPAGSRS